jgi:uncharacterized membrane protein
LGGAWSGGRSLASGLWGGSAFSSTQVIRSWWWPGVLRARRLYLCKDTARSIRVPAAGFRPTAWHDAAMSFLVKLFFRGLAAILPLALTGYCVWWAVSGGEALLHGLVVPHLVEEESYWPGMGFALSIALVMAIGLLMYSFVVRKVYGRFTALLERIPGIKSVYGMIADVVQIFGSAEERPFRKVVLLTSDAGFEQIGFLTRDDFADLPDIGPGKVAIYLPMSYQLGGFTMVVESTRVREIGMSVEEAMRFCITAGVARHDGGTGGAKA